MESQIPQENFLSFFETVAPRLISDKRVLFIIACQWQNMYRNERFRQDVRLENRAK